MPCLPCYRCSKCSNSVQVAVKVMVVRCWRCRVQMRKTKSSTEQPLRAKRS